jgi:hypothetical protein
MSRTISYEQRISEVSPPKLRHSIKVSTNMRITNRKSRSRGLTEASL